MTASSNPAGVKVITGFTDDGINVGASATDPVGLYGVTPVAQQTLPVAATTAVTTALFNDMRTVLLNLGVGA